MATLRTRTVKSAGGDYTSLSAWEAGEQTNLVTADEIRQAECYAMSDTTSVTFDGWTTDSTRYIEVTVPSAERHDGKWNTSKYRLELTTVTGLDCVESDVRIHGIQLSQTTSTVNARGITLRGTGEYQISNIIGKGSYSGAATGFFINNNTTGTLKCWNVVIYDILNGGATMAAFRNNSTGIIYCYNATVHNCFRGYLRSNGTFLVKNCIAQDCTDDGYNGTFDAASTNNCSDIASDAPGSNSSTGEVTFVDEANDDFHLDSSDTVAKDLGADLSADANIPFSTDIDGATRSGTWDIGADEITSAATIEGDLDATLGPLTSSATGTVLITGTASNTLGALTLSGTGAVAIVGTADNTLGALTLSATGGAFVTGSADITLGDATLSGTGTVLVTGSLSSTLGELSASSTGTVLVAGSSDVTLGALTLSGAGAVAISGALDATLGTLTLTATGTNGSGGLTGTLSATLGALTCSNGKGHVRGILFDHIEGALKEVEGDIENIGDEISGALVELEGVL